MTFFVIFSFFPPPKCGVVKISVLLAIHIESTKLYIFTDKGVPAMFISQKKSCQKR